MKEENINALDEIHKGSCMGMDALHFIIEKVEDKKLKDILEKQYDDYRDIKKIIEDIYPKYDNDEPHKTSAMNKMMTWYGIEMKTFMDSSNSKIAELLLQGVNMGIIEGKKILNNKEMDSKVRDIVNKYVAMQERHVEILKEYL